MRGPAVKLREAVELVRTYGVRGVARRAAHEVRLRTGRYGDEVVKGGRVRLRLLAVDAGGARQVMQAGPIIDEARAVLAGRQRFFGGPEVEIGWPPRWHHHVRTGETWPAGVPWPAALKGRRGDVKWIWEPSRFGWVWLLARAWIASGDDRYRDELWRGVEDWLAQNPVGQGANWYCGQELTFRCFAVLFAASVTGARDVAGELARAAGPRLERTLGHAMSQRNNHALSEAIGLWTLAVMAPDEPGAAGRKARGLRAMTECLRDQFADDGAYIQESLNYHRLAVQVLLWARWVARSTGEELPAEVEGALRRSSAFLRGLVAPEAIGWPVYGHEDGADVLRLATHAHRDVRPLLAHLAAELGEPAPFAAGPWDEAAAWAGLRSSAAAAPREDGLRVTSSGYVTSTRGAWMVFSRVPRHRHHRPAHADALHVDVWCGGRNVALDPGTYAYSEPPPWDNALSATRVHNTCSAGARDQMQRRGRFLWTHWSEAVMERVGTSMWLARVRPAWGQDGVHRRLVRHGARQVDVLDVVEADDVIRLHWNLDGEGWTRHGASASWEKGGVRVTIAAADPELGVVREVCASADGTLGWASPTYGVKVPCTAVELECRPGRVWFRTTFHAAGDAPEPLPDAALARLRAGDLDGVWGLLR